VLLPGGWLAFDVFAPARRFVERRGLSGPTRFRDPRSGRATIYRERHRVEPAPDSPGGRILAMTFRYETVGARGGTRVRNVSLRHRLLQPGEIEPLLVEAGFKLIARWSGFDGRPLEITDQSGEQHIYLARLGTARA